MGAFFSRLRKKKGTIEVLEELDVEIKNCINFRLENQESQRRWIGRLTVWGIVAYVVLALLYYLIYFPVGWVQRIVYSALLIVVPVIFLMASRRSLMWYYSRRITNNEEKLLLLKEEKDKILEEVMENETYKKAKEILEKFDPDRHKTMTPPRLGAISNPSTPGSELRQRKGVVPAPKAPPPPSTATLALGAPPTSKSAATPASASVCPNGVVLRPPINAPLKMGTPAGGSSVGGTPIRPLRMILPPPGSNFSSRGPPPMMTRPPVLPRPVLQSDRGVLDKLAEYLVGAGPSNRYALICRRCHRHNGMALKEEFEYLAFHCAYCQFLNPAKRKRPSAPRLPESNPPSARESDAGSESDFNATPHRPTAEKPPSPSFSGAGDAPTHSDDDEDNSSPTRAKSSSRAPSMEPTVEEDGDRDAELDADDDVGSSRVQNGESVQTERSVDAQAESDLAGPETHPEALPVDAGVQDEGPEGETGLDNLDGSAAATEAMDVDETETKE